MHFKFYQKKVRVWVDYILMVMKIAVENGKKSYTKQYFSDHFVDACNF